MSKKLRRLVNERARGKPLQYIIGDQPFGGLDILCRKGVLIPRPETESYTTRVAHWILSQYRNQNHLQRSREPLRIIDLCTGTGCIPLLLHSLLAPSIPSLHIVGVDISPRALALANRNLQHNIARTNLWQRAAHEVHFVQADILRRQLRGPDEHDSPPPDQPSSLDDLGLEQTWDILISNPPYISPRAFRDGTTKRSVRLHEPKLALVPPPPPVPQPVAPASRPQTTPAPSTSTSTSLSPSSSLDPAHAQQDSFYPILLALSAQVRARLTVLECGDVAQAARVVSLATERFTQGHEHDGDGDGDGDEKRNVGGRLSSGQSSSSNVKAGIWRCDRDEEDGVGAASSTDGVIGDDDGDGDDGGARAVVIVREDV